MQYEERLDIYCKAKLETYNSTAMTGTTKLAVAKKSKTCCVIQENVLIHSDTTAKKVVNPRNGPHVSLGRKLQKMC